MRKDVRFGLVIGGSLLALLVICAALFDRGPTNPTNDVAVLPAQPGDSPQSSSPPASPADNHALDLTAKTDTGAATRPSSVAGGSSTGRDWTALLLNGDGDSGTAASRPSEMKAAYTEGPATRPIENKFTTARTHKVAAGETFSTIAAEFYGDSKYYTRLEDANPNVSPNRLKIGTIINVPALGEPIAPKSGAARDMNSSIASGANVDSSKSYRIRPSDTLMAIARRLYGDGQAWEKIYAANRDIIGSNPARLQVGMVLRLPEAPTAAPTN
jgi:nucleoid-associated protein YgaU